MSTSIYGEQTAMGPNTILLVVDRKKEDAHLDVKTSHAEQDALRQTSYGFALAALLRLELHRKVRERSD